MSYTKTTWVNNTTPIDENNLNKIESGIKNNDINIGEENYDNTKTYEVGDIVRYNEKIYKCITAITTAENFDISKWEQTNIVEIVQSEKSKIYELIEAISTPIVGEGENITLNDTAEKRFENFDIEGNSKQETSEVECCGDNINLFDKDNMTIGKIWSGITLLDSDVGNASPKIPVKAGKTYIRNAGYSSNYIIKEDNSVVDIQGGTNAITMPENSKYWIFNIPKDIDINTIKAEEGLISTPQSKHGQGCIKVTKCNKNLVGEIQKGYWWNNTGVFVSDNNFDSSKQIKVEPGKTYVGSLFDKNKKYVGKLVYTVFDKNKNFIRYSGEDTITIANNEKYVSLRTYTSQSSYVKNNNLLMQLEEGSTATSYEEHQSQSYTIPTQQPMRAIGDTRDKFILKENGKWYERHYIARKIFDGTENFNLGTNANSLIYFFTNAGSIKAKSQDLLCNKLTTVTNLWNETENKNLIAIRSSLDLFNIMLSDTTINTVEKFKSWLSEQYNAGTPVYVDYVLATPRDIECTLEQTEILNQMYIKAKSYKGVTHIYSNDAVSPNCYVEAVKDLTTLIQ